MLADAFAFVVGSGRRLDKVDDARDDNACHEADAQKGVEARAFGKRCGQQQDADQFQRCGNKKSDDNSCNDFAHALNVVFLWGKGDVFAVKFAKLNA